MARLFREGGIRAEGNVLPLSEFKLYSDIKEASFAPDKLERVVKRAENYLNEDIPFLPLSLYREFFINGNRSNYEAVYFKRRDMVLTLAIAEAYEGKGRFADKLADVAWAISEESTWIIPAHTGHSPSHPGTSVPEVYSTEQIHGIDLFSATTAATLTAVCIYAGKVLDGISPLIRERLEFMIKERTVKPFVNCAFYWSGIHGNRPNNWCPWIVSNVLYVTANLEGDSYMRTRVVQRALDFIDFFTSFYHDDGGCDEGPGYWSHAGGSFFDCLETLEDMTGGKINIYSNPLVRAIGEYEAKMNIHGNRFVNFADCNGKVLPDGALLMRYGKKCGSDMLEKFGAIVSKQNYPAVNSSAPYRSIKALLTPTVTEELTPNAEKNTYLSGLKIMVSRESSDTSQGLFLAMKGGNNNESHNHNDIGNFIVYSNGQPVLIDVGVGTYTRQTFSSRRYELWFMQSNYHNLPTFDGMGEMQGAEYCSSDEQYDADEGSLSLQLAGAFRPEVGVKSFRRKAILTDGKITVSDDITLDKEREIDFHFMCCVAPVLNKPGEIALAEGRALRYDPSLECEIEEFFSEGLNAKAAWGTENLWRIHLRTNAKTFKGDFIVE